VLELARLCFVASLTLLTASPALPETDGLKWPLEISVTQSGIAGETGTRWLVEPSGGWTAYRVQSGQGEFLIKEGMLQPHELARITRVLEQIDFQSIFPIIGNSGRVNPQKLTIRWREKMIQLFTESGPDMLSEGNSELRGNQQATSLIELAREVRDLTTR